MQQLAWGVRACFFTAQSMGLAQAFAQRSLKHGQMQQLKDVATSAAPWLSSSLHSAGFEAAGPPCAQTKARWGCGLVVDKDGLACQSVRGLELAARAHGPRAEGVLRLCLLCGAYRRAGVRLRSRSSEGHANIAVVVFITFTPLCPFNADRQGCVDSCFVNLCKAGRKPLDTSRCAFAVAFVVGPGVEQLRIHRGNSLCDRSTQVPQRPLTHL